MVAQHNGISMIRCFCSEAAIGHAQKQGFVRGQKVQSNCTDGGLLVYQTCGPTEDFFEAGAACKCDTYKALYRISRLSNYEPEGRWVESLRARHYPQRVLLSEPFAT